MNLVLEISEWSNKESKVCWRVSLLPRGSAGLGDRRFRELIVWQSQPFVQFVQQVCTWFPLFLIHPRQLL